MTWKNRNLSKLIWGHSTLLVSDKLIYNPHQSPFHLYHTQTASCHTQTTLCHICLSQLCHVCVTCRSRVGHVCDINDANVTHKSRVPQPAWLIKCSYQWVAALLCLISKWQRCLSSVCTAHSSWMSRSTLLLCDWLTHRNRCCSLIG